MNHFDHVARQRAFLIRVSVGDILTLTQEAFDARNRNGIGARAQTDDRRVRVSAIYIEAEQVQAHYVGDDGISLVVIWDEIEEVINGRRE